MRKLRQREVIEGAKGVGYLWPRPMPRRHKNAQRGGNAHSRGSGGGWMHPKGKRKKKGGGQAADRAPLTPGEMHSRTRLR